MPDNKPKPYQPPPRKPRSEDEIINYYVVVLEEVYKERTAGDYTFDGILSEFLRQIDKAREGSQN